MATSFTHQSGLLARTPARKLARKFAKILARTLDKSLAKIPMFRSGRRVKLFAQRPGTPRPIPAAQSAFEPRTKSHETDDAIFPKPRELSYLAADFRSPTDRSRSTYGWRSPAGPCRRASSYPPPKRPRATDPAIPFTSGASPSSQAANPAASARTSLLTHLRSLRPSDADADLTIELKGQQHRLHRAVVSSNAYFARRLEGLTVGAVMDIAVADDNVTADAFRILIDRMYDGPGACDVDDGNVCAIIATGEHFSDAGMVSDGLAHVNSTLRPDTITRYLLFADATPYTIASPAIFQSLDAILRDPVGLMSTAVFQ
ncbi:hypothetical protein HK101_004081 [Irineochytrium annulatum]|nr:hypothetical protein HK101_004081 [Irineochytrium annulatum]